ncbi:MAG: DPP IV N-terminal domain-containing protein, partial [Cyclobacteriaceae bacterium]|nr:DPP IV N-terminal domain-containing protein [Cyclobacteriaceae bacterium]
MKNSIFLLLVFVFTSQSFAQQKSIDLKKLLSYSFPGHLTYSSENNTIFWVYNKEGVRNLWMAAGPDWKGHALTGYAEDDGQDISAITFIPYSKNILFVRGGTSNRQGEIPNPLSWNQTPQRQIFMINPESKQSVLLAEGGNPTVSPNGHYLVYSKGKEVWKINLKEGSTPEKLFSIRGNAGNLSFAPDGKTLAFTSYRGDHSFIGTYSINGQSVHYINPSVDKDSNPVWIENGNKLAFIRLPNARNELPFFSTREGNPWSVMLYDLKSGKTNTLWTSSGGPGSVFRTISASSQLFATNDGHLIFPYEGDGWTHLWAVSTQGGQAKCLTPGEFEVQYIQMGSDGNTLFYSSNHNDIDRQHIWSVSATGNPKQITQGKGIEWSPIQTNQGEVFCLSSTATQPAIVGKVD